MPFLYEAFSNWTGRAWSPASGPSQMVNAELIRHRSKRHWGTNEAWDRITNHDRICWIPWQKLDLYGVAPRVTFVVAKKVKAEGGERSPNSFLHSCAQRVRSWTTPTERMVSQINHSYLCNQNKIHQTKLVSWLVQGLMEAKIQPLLHPQMVSLRNTE